MKPCENVCYQGVDWKKRHRESLALAVALIQVCILASCAPTVQKPSVPDATTSNVRRENVNREAAGYYPVFSDRVPRPVGGFPVLISKLRIPDEFRRNAEHGEAGTVKVKVWIGADGTLQKIQMVNSADRVLVDAVARALTGVSWLPAKKNGRPVAAIFTLPVTFMNKPRPSTKLPD